MKQGVFVLLVALGMLASSPARAGRDEPIQDLTDIPVTWTASSPPTLDQVGQAVIAGCATRGWVCQITAPGQIKGTIHVRSHRADVRITYDTERYSIAYDGSDNLRYDADENTIHRNYNRWVANLRNDINLALTTISTTIAATQQPAGQE
jgi:hypothetical protein